MSKTGSFNYPEDLPDTLSGLIERNLSRFEDTPFLLLEKENRALSYSDSLIIIDCIIRRLKLANIQKGDIVCSYAPITPESVLLFLGVVATGAVFVPIDFQWPTFLLDKVLSMVMPSLVFCDVKRIKTASHCCSCPIVTYESEPQRGKLPGVTYFSDWLEEITGTPLDKHHLENAAGEDAAVILFTSGTTGEPKGVVLSHGSLVRSGWLLHAAYGLERTDKMFCLGELSSMSGLRNQCISPLFSGNSVVLTSEAKRSNVFAIVEVIKQQQCTILSTAPALIRTLLQFSTRLRAEGKMSLRGVISTGSYLSTATIEEFCHHYSVPLYNYYGLTETTGICIGITAENSRAVPGSIGIPIGAVAEVVDENDNVLGVGKIGELRIQSRNLMKGYLNDPEKTSEVIKNNWFYTGDMALTHNDGSVVLKGRKRDIIKDPQGNLIYPAEIETVLERHPLVSEAGACGFLDEGGNERIAVFIVNNDHKYQEKQLADELCIFVMEHLGIRKRPSILRFIGELPRGSNHKIDRKQLAKTIGGDRPVTL